MSLTRVPILAFDNNAWFDEMKNRQQLLGRLADRGWPVVFSNGPLSTWDRGTARWAEAPLLDHFVADGKVSVHVAGKLLPRWPKLPALDRLALRRHARILRNACGRAGRHDFVTFLFNPAFAPVANALGGRWLAFHHRDAYSELGPWSEADARAMQALNREADLLTVCAAPLFEGIDPELHGRVRLLENAADAALFLKGRDAACPDDLLRIPEPRIGYVGVVSLKMDFNLMLALARARPEWHWVHIGPVVGDRDGIIGGSREITAQWHQLQALPNFHHLGPRPYHELPAYVAHMSVNVLIYRLDGEMGRWARFAVPLKLFEGLATGRPVVSCQLPALAAHTDVMACTSGVDGWLDSLQCAITGNGPGTEGARIEKAFKHTWDSRVDDLEEWLLALTSRGTDGDV